MLKRTIYVNHHKWNNNESQIRRQQTQRKQRRLEQPDSCISARSDTLVENDIECASSLLILKYRISPNIESDIEKMKYYRVPDNDKKDDNLEKSLLVKKDNGIAMVKKEDSPDSIPLNEELYTYNYETMKDLLGESDLLVPEDFVLVPDYIFYAMAQMKICYVKEADQVGCYKNRPLGFAGMCCKYCGGRLESGKYFPSTIRGLAQTTTTQTIIKHVGRKCHHCPKSVQQRLLCMQKKCTGGNYGRSDKAYSSSSKNESTNCTGGNKPKYGSRKVFFERLWARMHNQDVPKIPKEAFPEDFDFGDHKEKHQNMDVVDIGYDKSTSSSHATLCRKSSTSYSSKGIDIKSTLQIEKSNEISEINEHLEPQISSNERRGKRKRRAPTFYSN